MTKQFETWCAQMHKAEEETQRVRATLGPEKRHFVQSIRLPVSPRTRAVLERELKLASALRKRSPEQWVAAILKLPEHQRSKAAYLVWWDYFSLRPKVERWPHLDRWLKLPQVPLDREETMAALHAVGYTPWQAYQRERPEGSYESTERQPQFRSSRTRYGPRAPLTDFPQASA